MRILHTFAGGGGSLLAFNLIGNTTSLGCIENDAYCCAVLKARGEKVICNDIRNFKPQEHDLVGKVDIVAGGWPCQGHSISGLRKGLQDHRSGLWSELLRSAVETEAPVIFAENVRGVLSSNSGRDFGYVLHSLAKAGYDASWTVTSAEEAGAPHRRERLFMLATNQEFFKKKEIVGHSTVQRWIRSWTEGQQKPRISTEEGVSGCTDAGGVAASRGSTGIHHGGMGGNSDGLANGMEWPASRGLWPSARGETQEAWEPSRILPGYDPQRIVRLKILGNGWVPAQAYLAWHELVQMLEL